MGLSVRSKVSSITISLFRVFILQLFDLRSASSHPLFFIITQPDSFIGRKWNGSLTLLESI